MRKWTYLAGCEDAGKSVGEILRSAGFSKKEISRQKFSPQGILLDGEPCRITRRVEPGQTVTLCLQEKQRPEMAVQLEAARYGHSQMQPRLHTDLNGGESLPPLEVYYEDEDLLVVNKPAGLTCHLGRGHYRDNLGSYLQSQYPEEMACPVRLIGRLDKDTSGLVVLAKSQAAAARVWKQRSDGTFVKYYQALIHGHLDGESGTIDTPLRRASGEKNRMQADSHGMRAVTHYRVLEHTELAGQEASLLECRLETGRTHQIRVHMASAGHPLFGDPLYGVKDGALRLWLHAQRVCLRQPFTGVKIEVCTPPVQI